jgi:hypothetical protein
MSDIIDFKAFSLLSDALRAAAQRNRTSARAQKENEARTVRAFRIEDDTRLEVARQRSEGVEELDIHESEIRQRIRQRYESNVLDDYAVLILIDPATGKEVSVSVPEIRREPEKYHGWQGLDLTEPEYLNRKVTAVVWTDGGTIRYFSRAHGDRLWVASSGRQTRVWSDAGHASFCSNVAADLVASGQFFRKGGGVYQLIGSDLRPVDALLLEAHLGTAYDVEKYDARRKKRVRCSFPQRAAQMIYRLAMEQLPEVDAFRRQPIVWGDGAIQESGFVGGRLVACDARYAVGTLPNAESTRRAFETTMRPFREYQFASPRDRTLFVIALLTAVNRAAWGTAPLWLIEAARRGSGKTILASSLCELAGAWSMIDIAGVPPEEAEKRLVSVVRGPDAASLLDNLTTGAELNRDPMPSMLTAPTYNARPFGRNDQTVTCSTVRFWVATANNPDDWSGTDIARRARRVRIEPRGLRPEIERFPFDPLTEVRRNRVTIVGALLSLLASARPGPGTLGSFEDWAVQVSGTIEVLRGAGVDLLPFDEAMTDPTEIDRIGVALALLLEELNALPTHNAAGSAFSVKEIVAVVSDAMGRPAHGELSAGADVWSAILGLCEVKNFKPPVDGRGMVSSRSLSRLLQSVRGHEFAVDLGGGVVVQTALSVWSDRKGLPVFQCRPRWVDVLRADSLRKVA